MGTLISSKGTHKSKAACRGSKCMAEGGSVDGDKGERIYKVSLGDPRSGPEKLVGLINRVVSGNGDAPVRRYDDSPTQMAVNRQRSGGTSGGRGRK